MIIRKLEETRLNTHQQHFEDLVLFGEEGLDEIDDKIERFKLKLQDKDSGLNTTTKIDGAPAVVCWHKFKGLPDNSICLKSFMTNNPKVISSLEDIESKYSDRPGMSKMLEYCLELSRYIPSGEAWQGDCLFISNTKKEREINGTDYITFQPNKIIYAFSENNPGYEDVKNAEFGIAFHTIYTGDVENKSQNFNVKAEDLNVPSKFYILSPALSITNKQEFNLDEIDNLQIKFNKEADNLKSDRVYNELINNKEFMSYWNTFENSNLADKKATTINVNTFIADLKEYINDKLEKEYNKKLLTLKTDKGKEKALLNKNDSIVRLNDLVENNKQTLTNLVNCLNTAATIKMLMWQGFKKNKTPYDTYYQSKSKGYIQADPEGIAMSDSDGNIVKLVDRSTFSSYNRDDDFISGFDHNESLEALDAFKLLEDVEDRKAAVAIFGKFNPPTRAHRKMIQAISDKAKSIGATPIVFASHKVGGDKHPLSYEDKFKYLKAAFGDLAEVKKSEANTPFQVLHELYLDGYTDVIYFSGPDRIGLKSSIPAYNGPKNDKLSASDYYKFNTVDVEILDFEGSPESEIRATKARQAVKDNDFEKFKTLVPFTENVAKQLFNELKISLGIIGLNENTFANNEIFKHNGSYLKSVVNYILKNNKIILGKKGEKEVDLSGFLTPDIEISLKELINNKDNPVKAFNNIMKPLNITWTNLYKGIHSGYTGDKADGPGIGAEKELKNNDKIKEILNLVKPYLEDKYGDIKDIDVINIEHTGGENNKRGVDFETLFNVSNLYKGVTSGASTSDKIADIIYKLNLTLEDGRNIEEPIYISVKEGPTVSPINLGLARTATDVIINSLTSGITVKERDLLEKVISLRGTTIPAVIAINNDTAEVLDSWFYKFNQSKLDTDNFKNAIINSYGNNYYYYHTSGGKIIQFKPIEEIIERLNRNSVQNADLTVTQSRIVVQFTLGDLYCRLFIRRKGSTSLFLLTEVLENRKSSIQFKGTEIKKLDDYTFKLNLNDLK